MPDIRIFPDKDALAAAAAELVVAQAQAAVAARGAFHFVLSGGSTPRALYARLAGAPYREQLDWAQMQVYWGDERCVDPDDAESNYRMARETLLAQVPVPPAQLHRMAGEIQPREAAAQYEHLLRQRWQRAPQFDLLLLGLGDDGHTASLFPHTAALDETARWVVPNYVPKLESWRLTLTAPAINAARTVVFLVSGGSKAVPLVDVLYGERQPHTLPAQLITPASGALLWLVDADAAARLPR